MSVDYADAAPAWAREAARRLLGAGVAVAALDPRIVEGELLPEERPAVARAVDRRRREFTAGRLAARHAMAELGVPVAPVPSGPDRAPIWPDGLVGSISHTAECCLAVVARRKTQAAVGIDLETDEPLPQGLAAEICRPEELDWLARQPPSERGRLARLVFSAKEAAYKCQYPLTGTLFGFETLRIEFGDGTFRAIFAQPVGQFAAGSFLRGRFSMQAGQILNVVSLRV